MTDNPPVSIYVNEIANTIIFEIKTGYYLELQTPETMKSLRSTKNKITKDEDSETATHLEMTTLARLSKYVFVNLCIRNLVKHMNDCFYQIFVNHCFLLSKTFVNGNFLVYNTSMNNCILVFSLFIECYKISVNGCVLAAFLNKS